MRRALSIIATIAATIVLASCSFLPSGPAGVHDDFIQRCDARMEQIVEALNNRDTDALKAMFSQQALDQATDIDRGLEYLVSFFPDGIESWKQSGCASEERVSSGKKTELLNPCYIVSADGSDYYLCFADFTVNDVINPNNVGIYLLGVAPWTEDPLEGATEPFIRWARGVKADESNSDTSYPGVYIPE